MSIRPTYIVSCDKCPNVAEVSWPKTYSKDEWYHEGKPKVPKGWITKVRWIYSPSYNGTHYCPTCAKKLNLKQEKVYG